MGKSIDEDWVKNGLLVFGALGTLVGIGGWLTQDLTLLLAFVAGAGWTLAVPLLVIVGRNSRELSDLRREIATTREASEAEARDLRQQISEWRTIATQDSESLNRFVSRAVEMPIVHPRRAGVLAVDPEGEE
ncbi:hypothetical protein PYH37_002817 [Sinorhizobium numidicum]|uniref:Uncharacterized protein n=1 Tax=Sinorhizobium numidicum TaxID=680248 RepID=A0ABY8D4J7_9HYPH|nr:hypothetical protein [Sinorhizobium numidicum]WEX77973.1 hypothetical protein PYH37_002817 [Sinorhizobium numidicum]WEX84632.1 hypothetical protein PYH38_003530 [Sinorhizobium numidicum]